MKPTNTVAVAEQLFAYCRNADWAGYDPYDSLNSKVLQRFALLNRRIPRLAITQAMKRSPLNFRRLLLVPKTQNPKGLGLFLSASLKLAQSSIPQAAEVIDELIERIIALRSPDTRYWCWGYSFPWQMRSKIVPSGAPNLVCTTFVGNALLDAYEQRGDPRCLEMALSAAEYLVKELYWADGETVAGLAYPLPEMRTQVHNANFLGAAFLARVARHTGETAFIAPALKVARYSAERQRPDGSWYYGEARSQKWIDNFHTGYNLCALRSLSTDAKTQEFDAIIRRGFDFYRTHFIRADGAPRYFHDRTYPIDIHSAAQSIITLLTFRDLDSNHTRLAESVLQWTVDHMWDNRGYFYYRVLRSCTIRTPYMRWSQAWMCVALASLLTQADKTGPVERAVSLQEPARR